MTEKRIAGLVLAGGRSRRFGREKAMALLAGRPLIDWSLMALDGVCEAVAVSAAPGVGAGIHALAAGRAVLHDDPAHPAGPLAGLAAGLAWARNRGCDRLVCLPCDTPGVRPEHLRQLIAALDDAEAAYAITEAGVHGLCAVWRASFAPALAARLSAGDHPPVRRLLAEIDARAVIFADSEAFRNVNTAADLAGRAPAI